MRAGRSFFAGLLILAVSTAALAHELRTIATTATFPRDGPWVVELIVDSEPLPPGFGARSLREAQKVEGMTPLLDRKIGRIVAEAVRGASPAFDGRRGVPRIELGRIAGETDEAVAAGAEIRLLLTGRIPAGAKTFTWG